MTRTTFSTLFFIKRSKLLRTGEAPIYCRVTVNGLRAEFAIKRSIDPVDWDINKGRAKTSNRTKQLNQFLEHIKHNLYEKQRIMEDEGKQVTAKNLVLAYHGKNDNEKFLVELFEEHNNNIERLIGNGYCKLTHVRYKSSIKHLKEFLVEKYRVTDIPLRSINSKFVSDYEVYLRSDCKCKLNTTSKYLKNLKKVINIGLSNGWITVNPFAGKKLPSENGDRVYLDNSELEIIEKKQFSIDRLNQVKDIFLFCCYTGLAFVDVEGLKPTDIITGVDGRKWIIKKRQKTQVKFMVPLFDNSLALINKYKENLYCKSKGVVFPVLSNQRMNAYLKEIQNLCGIKKNLTTHCARHTFATTVTLAQGVSMEAVSKMLGHASMDMTRHYARITESLISSEMEKIQAISNQK